MCCENQSEQYDVQKKESEIKLTKSKCFLFETKPALGSVQWLQFMLYQWKEEEKKKQNKQQQQQQTCEERKKIKRNASKSMI